MEQVLACQEGMIVSLGDVVMILGLTSDLGRTLNAMFGKVTADRAPGSGSVERVAVSLYTERIREMCSQCTPRKAISIRRRNLVVLVQGHDAPRMQLYANALQVRVLEEGPELGFEERF